MNKEINLAKKNEAIDSLKHFKNREYYQDIEFTNIHLIKINELVGFNLFTKNSLFANSATLFELMQPTGKIGRHHYHGLRPDEIIELFINITRPNIIYRTYLNRIGILITIESTSAKNFLLIIELNSTLLNKRNANINKLITIYPKDHFSRTMLSLTKDILYIKK